MNVETIPQPKWKLILHTPISSLLRGRITGPQEPLEQLDTSALPENLVAAIRQIADRLEGRLRWTVALRLTKSCSSLLREGCAATQLVEQLSEPASIAALIRITRHTDWILSAPLPARLWPTVERIVIHEGVKQRAARKMLNRVCQTLQWQLDGGRSPAEIASQCGDAAALSGLVYETHSLGELLEYRLSEPLLAVVLDVVQRTRLWLPEKRDVAQELCAHFADGLEKGESEAALIESFGSPQTAAKLIRRARLRNRPFHWRARRRVWQTLAILFVLILVPWVFLALRFLTAQPTVKFDVLQEYDKQSRTIPRQERAWPLYLQGLETLKADKEFENYRKYEPTEEISGKDWLKAKAFYNRHPGERELFLEAAKHPELGFIYRPQTNDLGKVRELNRPYEGNSADRQQTNLSILLPHLQDLSYYVAPFLRGASLLAAEEGNSEQCFDLFQARLAVAEHISQVIDCPITYIAYHAKTRLIAQDLERLVQQQPELFTEQQLTTLFQTLKQTQEKSIGFKHVERLFIRDFIQKAYTDDGEGNGRFTANGFRILYEAANFSEQKQDLLRSLFLLGGHSRNRSSLSSQDSQYEILAAPLISMFADRKQMEEKLHELYELLWNAKATGDRDRQKANQQYLDAYNRLRDSAADRIRYLPALLLLPDKASNMEYLQKVSRSVQAEIALTQIAVDLYRRKQGRYPESLQELVPTYFAEIPVDPQTGKPLRYQIQEGLPVVKSLSTEEFK